MSRSRRRGSRRVNLLQRGCDRGGEWGNTPSSSTSNPVNCKIRSRRLSSRRGGGIRWGRGKHRALIIEGDLSGSFHRVVGVSRDEGRWGRLVFWWGMEIRNK